MARRPVLAYPDPRLCRPASVVEHFDASLAALADDLRDTLAATPGIALSAPQLGDLRQVVVIDVPADGVAPAFYVNPRILSRSAWGFVEESCLSVPGASGLVLRATRLRVAAQTLDGTPFACDLDGMHAVCLQHECDHLAGKLFVTRLWFLRRLLWHAGAGRRLRKAA
ncbi:MAG: peptide deformylase [Gammaproteobacteria bacterium]